MGGQKLQEHAKSKTEQISEFLLHKKIHRIIYKQTDLESFDFLCVISVNSEEYTTKTTLHRKKISNNSNLQLSPQCPCSTIKPP